MAPISLKKSIVDELAAELIVHLLDVGAQEENFKIANEYVMSNLRFHRFLDVNPLDVSRSLIGICAKFRVNAQDKKAGDLENLVEEFVNEPLIEREGAGVGKEVQTDVHYSLLSLMLNLSNNPLKSHYVEKCTKSEQKDEVEFDWGAYLLAGEERLDISVDTQDEKEKLLNDSYDEFWELTDDEHDEYIENIGVGQDSVFVASEEKVMADDKETEYDTSWIYSNVVPSYWKDSEHMNVKIGTEYQSGNCSMFKNWEIYKRECGLEHGERSSQKLLTERQLVMETIWMLQGLQNYVYSFTNGKYTANKNIAVSHLTDITLQGFLNKFTSIGDKVARLKQYSDEVLHSSETVSKSFRAFAFVIGRYLMKRSAFFADLEKDWISKEKTMTLIVLNASLFEDRKHVNCIYQLYVQAICKGSTLYSTQTERLVCFFDVFYNKLVSYDNLGGAGKDEFCILFPMFVDVCLPYLTDLDNWMTMGQLPRSNDEEFMIFKAQNIEKGEPDYWMKTFKVKETKDGERNVTCLVPSFIEGMQKQILLAGKSLGLLAEFGNYATKKSSVLSVYDEFKQNIRTRLQGEEDVVIEEEKEDHKEPTCFYTENPEIDPLLKENFRMMFLNVYTQVQKAKYDGNRPRVEPNAWLFDLLKQNTLTPPFSLLLEQCLLPVVTKRYKEACAFLLEFFKNEFKLFDHLKVMGRFFLMQAGGTMHDFLSELFDMAKRSVKWEDVSYLNIVLQDALQLEFPNMVGLLKVELQGLEKRSSAQMFDGLLLRYSAPWPITIILDSKTEEQYNEIFKFLLKVKRAIWVLEHLRFYELIVEVGDNDDESDGSSDGGDSDGEVREHSTKKYKSNEVNLSPRKKLVRDDRILEPAKQQLKQRLVILRMKMLHALQNFHFYLMNRITFAVNDELNPKVHEAKDLEEIIEVHYMFLRNLKKRCFLHENIGRSKEAIFRILSLVFDFELLWLSNIDNIDGKRLDIIDNDFHRCKAFLHSFFSTLGKRGSYPHFEFLAYSLKV